MPTHLVITLAQVHNSLYAPEFRRQMIDMVRAGRDPDDLAREFEPTAQSIRNWVAQAEHSEGRREAGPGGMSNAEREELFKLRREVRQLRLERLDPRRGSSLSKAAAGSASLTIPPGDRLRRWFARETGTIPSGPSGS